jgi:hypothetical protein
MKNKILFLQAFLFLSLLGKAQIIGPDSLLVRWTTQQPIEKVYVQFDNKRYAPGQTIWFKAYLSSLQLPSNISKNFYLDFHDANGKLAAHISAPIVSGVALGNWVVPEKFQGETVTAIGYTNWMRNFDSTFYFKRTLTILSNLTTAQKPTTVLPETTVQFLPEAGNVILGIPCNMAFKAVNQNGLPEQISGIIQNKAGEEITNFETTHHGMGTFQYLPQAGETYTAIWKDPLGNSHQTVLPIAEAVGVNLILHPGSLERSFEINRSAEVPEAWKKITILAQANGEVLFKAVANLTNKTAIRSKIPVMQFPSGVAQLTLFDANNQPICERLFFVNNEEYVLNASIKTDTLSLEKRGKNVFEITVEDSTVANLSLAITDGNVNGASDDNILSSLLLTSDIKGYVHNPAYYFTSGEDSLAKQLDLVMLTNGWRRYSWKSVMAEKLPKLQYTADSAYLSLYGKIEGLSENKIKKAELMNMILQSKDSSKSMIFLPIEPDGTFSQPNVILYDTTRIFYKLNAATLWAKNKVSIWNNLYTPDKNRMITNTHFNIDTAGNGLLKFIAAEAKRLEQLKLETTLKEVVVKSKVKTPMQELDQKYASGLFSNDGIQFDLTQANEGGNTVLGYLQSRVAGLLINNPNSPDASATWRGSRTDFFLNEFQSDAQQIFNINMNDVAYIKVFRPPFFGSFGGGAGGAIAIYTKKGIDATRNIKGLDYLEWMGYSPRKEFYSPNYAEQQAGFNTADLRNTLLWMPWINTNRNNQTIKVQFYNNDFSKSLHLILEGMDNEGKLVHISKLLQ